MKKRVIIGLISAIIVAFSLDALVESDRELMDERQAIEESGYAYDGETVVSEELYAELSSYTKYYRGLGGVIRLKTLDGDMVLIDYNFISQEYYPELTPARWGRYPGGAYRSEVILKINAWVLAPAVVFILIVFYPVMARKEARLDGNGSG